MIRRDLLGHVGTGGSAALRRLVGLLLVSLATLAGLVIGPAAADAAIASLWTEPMSANGGLVFATPTGSVLTASPGVGTSFPVLQSVKPDGVVAWSLLDTPNRTRYGGEGVVADGAGNSYSIVEETTATTFRSVDPTGVVRWSVPTGGFGAAGGSVPPVLGPNGDVYFAVVGQSTWKVMGLDSKTGTVNFTKDFSYISGLYAYSGGLVVVDPLTNQVTYVGYDGSVTGPYSTGSAITNNTGFRSAGGADGTVFVSGYGADCNPTAPYQGTLAKASVEKVTPTGVAWTWTEPAAHLCSETKLASTPDGGAVVIRSWTNYQSAESTSISPAGVERWTYSAQGPSGPALSGGFRPVRVDVNGIVALPSDITFPCSYDASQQCVGTQIEFLSQTSKSSVLPTLTITNPSSRYFMINDLAIDSGRAYVARSDSGSSDGSLVAFAVPGLGQDYRVALQVALTSGPAPVTPPPTVGPTPPSGGGATTPPSPTPPPCSPPPASGKQISLFSYGTTLMIGTTATLTSSVTTVGPLIGQPGKKVTFRVDCGPSAGKTAESKTDIHGQARFSYKGPRGAGTDSISASVVDTSGRSERAVITIKWIVPPPIVNPCAASASRKIGARLLASLKCTTAQLVLTGQCATAIAGFVFIPLKLLKSATNAKGLLIVSKLDKAFHPAARLYNKLMAVKYLSRAPVGFKTAQEVRHKLEGLRKVSTLVRLIPDLRQALSEVDFNAVALDISEVAGLKPCVQALVNGLQ